MDLRRNALLAVGQADVGFMPFRSSIRDRGSTQRTTSAGRVAIASNPISKYLQEHYRGTSERADFGQI